MLPLGRLGSGWQIGSVASFASGRPFTVLQSTGTDNSGQDKSYQRADCLVAPQYQYSDPNSFIITNVAAVFAEPAPGTIGTCGRNAFRGPHFVQWDANLNKTTKINERLSIQFRWEVFNLLNHPNFNPIPGNTTFSSFTPAGTGTCVTSPGCGPFLKVTQTPDIAAGNPFLSSGGPRAMQLGVKIIF